MIIVIALVILILLALFFGLLNNIKSIDLTIKPTDFSKVYYYAKKIQKNYLQYQQTSSDIYQRNIMNYLTEIKKYMDLYDVRYIYGIDLIQIDKTINSMT